MKTDIAQALLKIGAIGFKPDQPLIFKSGIISPMYCDNRIFPAHPEDWKQVLQGFKNLIETEKIEFDVIAGIESAGIPHSAALGFLLQKPSVFCRKAVKDHGTKKMIEGGDVTGKKSLLIEDLVTTGSSSLEGVKSLRSSGAIVTDCLVIFSYEFPEAEKAFVEAKVKLHSLTDFATLLTEAVKQKKITEEQRLSVDDWHKEPWGWAKRHGFDK